MDREKAALEVRVFFRQGSSRKAVAHSLTKFNKRMLYTVWAELRRMTKDSEVLQLHIRKSNQKALKPLWAQEEQSYRGLRELQLQGRANGRSRGLLIKG